MAVKVELEKVLAQTEAITDAHILDHALANLTKLSASLQVHIPKESNEEMPPPSTFVSVEKFPPAKKNELQLRFSKTTNSAGRKQKMVPLLYVNNPTIMIFIFNSIYIYNLQATKW